MISNNKIKKIYWLPIIFLFVLIVIFSISCERIIDYDFPEYEKSLVINGLFHPDSNFYVIVSQTFPSYDKDPLRYNYIENATVNLYENKILLGSLNRIIGGKYKANDFKPQIGNTYKIQVSAPGFDSVRAESYIPVPVNIKIDSIYSIIKDRKEYLACDLIINDPEGDNYYYLVSYTIPDYFKTKLSNYNLYSYWIDDPLIGIWSSDNTKIPELLMFSDKGFNGNSYKFTVYATPLHQANEEVSVYFSLASITEDFYKYGKTYNNQIHTSYSNLADKSPVFNNIENGYGIFSGYSIRKDSFVFEGVSEEEILYFGTANYKGEEFGLQEAKIYKYFDKNEFELNLGSISIIFDDETNELKGAGVILSIIMISNNINEISVGEYNFDETGNNIPFSISSGNTYINDTTEIILPEPFEINGGRIIINSFQYDKFIKEYIIDLEYNLALINNENIQGYYEGPVYVIEDNK